jgi:hypothetical protein
LIFDIVRDQFGNVVMGRERMASLRHADLRIRASALFLADHELDDASEIGSKRQELQIEHQRRSDASKEAGAAHHSIASDLRLSLLRSSTTIPNDRVQHGRIPFDDLCLSIVADFRGLPTDLMPAGSPRRSTRRVTPFCGSGLSAMHQALLPPLQ